ncbi:MAG TPA: ABC transporter permease [Gelria sp.]|jgi:ABC-type nitrate/sulfonate/bicarbonate transport system permease component|nr:ABC transporter permease [Gelria sp.]
MKTSANIANKTAPLIAFLILLVIWELGVRIYHIPSYILASPSQVLVTIAETYPMLWFHGSMTLLEAISGFVLAIVIAFIMAFLLDTLFWLNQAVYPLLIVSQTIPLIVLAVLFTIWFGFGLLPKILVVILVCFFPMVISLSDGLNNIDPDQINLFRSMGASRLKTFSMVKLPAALPAFFSGIRISATYSIMAAVIAEWLGSNRGLGYYMTLQQKQFAIDRVLAAVVVICLLSLLLVKLIDLLEYLLVPWNRKDSFDTEEH